MTRESWTWWRDVCAADAVERVRARRDLDVTGVVETPTAQDMESSLLCMAARFNAVRVGRHLLAHGGSVEAAQTDDATPLMLAAMDNCSAFVQLLLERPGQQRPLAALSWATTSGHLETMRLLLKAGVGIHEEEWGSASPVDAALSDTDPQPLLVLLQHEQVRTAWDEGTTHAITRYAAHADCPPLWVALQERGEEPRLRSIAATDPAARALRAYFAAIEARKSAVEVLGAASMP